MLPLPANSGKPRNLAGAREPAITSYILQNNQIALDTPPAKQSGVEVWADKAAAMGFPAWTIDGSDPAAWHASAAVAPRNFSMAGGGPTLIHVETMRGCGHAHHHDDLYLGNPSGTPTGHTSIANCWTTGQQKTPFQPIVHCCWNWEPRGRHGSHGGGRGGCSRGCKSLRFWPWRGPSPRPSPRASTTLHDADTHADHLQRYTGLDRTPDTDAPLQVGELAWTYAEKGGWTYARKPFNKPWRTSPRCTATIACSSVRTWK